MRTYYIGEEIDLTDVVFETLTGAQIFKRILPNGKTYYGCARNLMITANPIYKSIQVLTDYYYLGTNENDMEIRHINGATWRNCLRSFNGNIKAYDDGLIDSPYIGNGNTNYTTFVDNEKQASEYTEETKAFVQSHVPIVSLHFKVGERTLAEGELRYNSEAIQNNINLSNK